MKSPWARPLGIMYLLLGTHAAIGALMLLKDVLRIVPEQLMFQILAVAVPRQSALLLIVSHFLATAALATTLRMWHIQHPRTRLAVAITAGIHGLLAPVGLLVTAALVWFLRHPEIDADTPIAPIAGDTRARLVGMWCLATVTTWILAYGAFMLIGNAVVWFPVMLLVPVPQGALGYWLMQRPERKDAINAMPELPSLQGRQA